MTEEEHSDERNIEKMLKLKNVDGQTALHLAAQSGSVESCELMILESKEIINVQDNNGNTPLHLACIYGRIKVVEKLLLY